MTPAACILMGDSRTQKNADDVVITLAIRTPLTRARKGGLKARREFEKTSERDVQVMVWFAVEGALPE